MIKAYSGAQGGHSWCRWRVCLSVGVLPGRSGSCRRACSSPGSSSIPELARDSVVALTIIVLVLYWGKSKRDACEVYSNDTPDGNFFFFFFFLRCRFVQGHRRKLGRGLQSVTTTNLWVSSVGREIVFGPTAPRRMLAYQAALHAGCVDGLQCDRLRDKLRFQRSERRRVSGWRIKHLRWQCSGATRL